MFGEFDTEEYGTMEWVLFGIATVLLPLLMMNLLIAIISDTFARVHLNRIESDYKEKALLLRELENMMFWNRNKSNLKFLHIIRYKGFTEKSTENLVEQIFEKLRAIQN